MHDYVSINITRQVGKLVRTDEARGLFLLPACLLAVVWIESEHGSRRITGDDKKGFVELLSGLDEAKAEVACDIRV